MNEPGPDPEGRTHTVQPASDLDSATASDPDTATATVMGFGPDAAIRRGADATDLRRAMEDARAVLSELLDLAIDLGGKGRVPRIAAALRAALVDPDVAAALAAGRLSRLPEAATGFAATPG